MLSRRGLLAAGVLGASLALAGCARPPGAPTVRMACGQPGGTYVRFGSLLGAALERRGAPGLEVLTSSGSLENLDLLADGDAELAIALADAADAHPDRGSFAALGRVYQNYLQCVVRADGAVWLASDLAGCRLSIGAPRSGASATVRRVLEHLGLTGERAPASIVEQGVEDAIAALRDGAIDAMFWSGGVPMLPIAELAVSAGVRLIDVTGALPTLDASYPGLYRRTELPVGAYRNAGAVPTIGTSNLLLGRVDLEDAVAAAVAGALVDDAAALVPDGSLGVQYLSPANVIDTWPMALHPAAKAAYRERYG